MRELYYVGEALFISGKWFEFCLSLTFSSILLLVSILGPLKYYQTEQLLAWTYLSDESFIDENLNAGN